MTENHPFTTLNDEERYNLFRPNTETQHSTYNSTYLENLVSKVMNLTADLNENNDNNYQSSNYFTTNHFKSLDKSAN